MTTAIIHEAKPPDAFVSHEITRFLRTMLRVRVIAIPTLLLTALLFFLYEPVTWKVVLCLAGALALSVVVVADRPLTTGRTISPRRALGVLASILSLHAMAIVLTGGITSPVTLVVPALAQLIGFLVGARPLVMAGLAGQMLLAWLLTVEALAGSPLGLVPRVLARGDEGALPLGLVAFSALLLTGTPILGGVIGMRLRHAMTRAVATTAQARNALLGSLRERNEELRAMSGAVAHELKNPLAAVRGLAALQEQRATPGSREAEQLGVLLAEVQRMADILDEFLNFARPLRSLAFEQADAGALIAHVVDVHEALARERSVALIAEIGTTKPLECDRRKVEQALVNLLQNALDASSEGGEVRVSVRLDHGSHCFEVCDRGPGLDDAIRGRLFSPGATTKRAGSGLGLTITRAIAEQHGGTLFLEERAGGGCRAELRLPTAAMEMAS